MWFSYMTHNLLANVETLPTAHEANEFPAQQTKVNGSVVLGEVIFLLPLQTNVSICTSINRAHLPFS